MHGFYARPRVDSRKTEYNTRLFAGTLVETVHCGHARARRRLPVPSPPRAKNAQAHSGLGARRDGRGSDSPIHTRTVAAQNERPVAPEPPGGFPPRRALIGPV